MMDAGQEITAADIKAALQKQNIPESDIKPGDAIMFHTGWGSLWMKNNDRFNSGEPGIGSTPPDGSSKRTSHSPPLTPRRSKWFPILTSRSPSRSILCCRHRNKRVLKFNGFDIWDA